MARITKKSWHELWRLLGGSLYPEDEQRYFKEINRRRKNIQRFNEKKDINHPEHPANKYENESRN